MKVDIRVGEVLSAARVRKSDKLLVLRVSFNTFERQILAGIGLTWDPATVVGGRYPFVVNLRPRKLMGLESHGMKLAEGTAPDKLSLSKTHLSVGARIGLKPSSEKILPGYRSRERKRGNHGWFILVQRFLARSARKPGSSRRPRRSLTRMR